MAKNPRRRQKQLERRAAKRKEKKQHLVKGQPTGLADRLEEAAKYPVLHAWLAETLWTNGIGNAILSRELPNGQVAFSVFLVDRSCLGVKDAYSTITTRSKYEDEFLRRLRGQFELQAATPATVRKFVEAAVAYAGDLGLSPHPDYHKAKMIFGDIDPGESSETFEFGKDGKPFFVAGPHDTPARCKVILNTLLERCGPDGFHYLIPMPLGEPGEILPEGLRHRDTRLIGEAPGGQIIDRQVRFDEE